MSRPSVRETIAAARAKMAQEQAKSRSIRGGAPDEREAFIGSGVPGVRKTAPVPRRQTDVEILGHAQKSIKSLIANAKGTGIMNLSSRELTEIPLAIWNMYHVDPDKVVVDFTSTAAAWYDAVDLTRLIASDNKITHIDARIQEFGALVSVDLRANHLTNLPEEFSNLQRLVQLNISSNKFTELPSVLFTLTTLVDLQLGGNQLSGTLDPAIANLTKLEALDLSNNELTELPQELTHLKAVRKLNLSKNKLEHFPVSILANMPKLMDLEIGDNKLGCLFSGIGELPTTEEGVQVLELPALVRLDARNSGLQRITDIDSSVDDSVKPKIAFLALKELLLSHNLLSDLENVLYIAPQLHYLDLRSNQFTDLPVGVLELSSLRQFDMASNKMEWIPSELGSMYDLTNFLWEGNLIKNIPRTCNNTDALMKLLRQRLTDGPSPADTARVGALSVDSSVPGNPVASSSPFHRSPPSSQRGHLASRGGRNNAANDTPALVVASPRKVSKNLTLSKKALKELTKEEILEACQDPQIALLDFNALTVFPAILQRTVGSTLTQITIHHNKISEFPFTLSFPLLLTLDISDNVLTSLETVDAGSVEQIGQDNFPCLNELNLSSNQIKEIPLWLPKAFPKIRTLSMARNKIATIDPKSFEGLTVLDLSGNDIATLPPLLGNIRSIKSLSLDGNLFRVPRRQIMDQGTEAVMEYLRGRIPA
ncbi:Ras suppressor protein 1 [Linnemannia gamsii]|uniref:Ras suppressor protein 1 n=1 Tax=Linnemannia gamsii TaxID=64522 RepID=A0ABQ7K0Y8_9FUNG|nr:Ras suppressor protein 1 [Linnemannia gamsii]